MNPRIPAAILGSTLLLQVSPAAASTIEWVEPASRALNLTWSSQSAEALAGRLAIDSARIQEDGTRDDRVGPTGGVLLHSFNGIAIELRPESGLVQAVKPQHGGEPAVRVLFDAFAAGPQVFARGGDTQVMVTMSVCREATASGLLDREKSTQKVQFQFDVVIYDGRPGGGIIDQVSLAYDASTLKPTITSDEARTFTDNWYEPSSYWQNASSARPPASPRARDNARGGPVARQVSGGDDTFYTPVSYWQAAAPTGGYTPNPYWGPTPELPSSPRDTVDPTIPGDRADTPAPSLEEPTSELPSGDALP